MKLFGNKRHPSHLEPKSGKLTGIQKGLLLLAGAVLILTVTVTAVYRDFVKPVEVKHPTLGSVGTEQVFRPPTTIQTQLDEMGREVEVELPASHKEGFYNILLLGTDDDGYRTDTIMIARLDVTNHTVALLSVPRDTMVESIMPVPKINGVYGYVGKGEKGINNLKSHLAKLLGFEVDGYAIVDLEAFVDLVDLLGGVEFDVPMDMYYSDPTQDLYIDLKSGRQKLDGQQAMQLVRYRKGYATQDLQRTQVQQDFLKALAEQCLKVTNLSKIGAMADIFKEHVTTDLTVGNLAYFGQELLKCDFENMYSYTLEGEAVYYDGVSYYAIYLQKTLDAVNGYFNPYDVEITADHVTILTPEYVRYMQSSKQAQQEEEQVEEVIPEEELPEEPVEEIPEEEFTDPLLPTDQWVEELPPEEIWP